MRRAIVIVMDGCGAGEAPDSWAFGDADHPATVRHVWERLDGFDAPNLAACGFLSACGIGDDLQRKRGLDPASMPARYGRLRELSKGKDSVTGHWEMMGVVTDPAFPTYPAGFPTYLVRRFEERIGRRVLANRPASGTQIIEELGAEHVRTGSPILYTSADSVFQIACHEEVVPLEQLYSMCHIARDICVAPDNIQRVIARPFIGDKKGGFRRTKHRKDFPLEAPHNLADEIGDVCGIGVIPELFEGRGFRPTPRTQSNAEHAKALEKALRSDASFIWANFEDFDMLYGHRNDVAGFGAALVGFDEVLASILSELGPDDLLLLSADHGNDPSSPSTDHSREYVPVVVIGAGGPLNLGDVDGMTAIGATVASHLHIPWKIGKDLTA